MPGGPDLGLSGERGARRPGSLRPGWMVTRLLGLVVLAALLCLTVGLVAFVSEIVQSRAPNRAAGEGVVVLTGGRDRIDVALEFLAEGTAKRLLISGVNPTTSAEAIRRQTGAASHLFTCCVDLGRRAETTLGNAYEAAEWVSTHHFRSVVIVTSAYHVPRALVELRAAFARSGVNVRIQAIGVRKQSLRETVFSFDGETLRLLLAEYVKYMLAQGRVLAEDAGLVPVRVTGLSGSGQTMRVSVLP